MCLRWNDEGILYWYKFCRILLNSILYILSQMWKYIKRSLYTIDICPNKSVKANPCGGSAYSVKLFSPISDASTKTYDIIILLFIQFDELTIEKKIKYYSSIRNPYIVILIWKEIKISNPI